MTSTLTLHYTYGLPGSGKTTLCRDFIKKSKRPITRVNRDDLRMMLFGSYWGKGVNETVVTQVQHGIIKDALAREHDVFCDDTNLSPHAQSGLAARAHEYGAKLVRHDLSHVPPWECIANDQKRDRQVGPKVIWDMWERCLKPGPLENTDDLPEVICVDIDGTLAHMNGKRGPFDWHKVGSDDVDPMVARVVDLLGKDYNILIVSGRDGVCRPETEQWLEDNDIDYDELFMRPENDNRPDWIVKGEILDWVQQTHFVALAIDDRDQVVQRVWRYRGIKCFQVARGDF